MPARTRGYCQTHYARVHRTGTDQITRTAHGERARYFREVVMTHQGDECLTWPYSRGSGGYGLMEHDGVGINVHRLACIEINGPPPEGKPFALHSCGRGHLGCVSPHHTRWGSQSENMADRIAHGTSLRGEDASNAKLSEASVRQILSMRGEMPQKDIADLFGVSPSAVSAVYKGRSWAWLHIPKQGERACPTVPA